MSALLQNPLPPWAVMWLVCFIIFFFCKGLSFYRGLRGGVTASPGRSLAYGFLWPGMDARTFLTPSLGVAKPKARNWFAAGCKTAFGIIVLWGVVRLVPPARDLLQGWIGMVGLIFLLHFGIFHLLALFWQHVGINAKTLFDAPVYSTSLASFWGGRWNDAFRQLTHDFIYQPLRNHTSKRAAVFVSFLISGFIHELAISVPARGGYGLPSLYFLIQGFGVLVERGPIGKSLGLDHGVRGWLFMAVCTTAPVFILFHPLFVRSVIVPFLQVIGASKGVSL